MRFVSGLLLCLLLILPFEARAQTNVPKCSDMNLGSYQFNEVNGTPLKLKLETCFDGTAWAEFFRLSGKLWGTLHEVQKTIDALINTKTNTCDARDFSVKASNTRVAMDKPDAKMHRARITMDIEAKPCAFPYVAIRLKTVIPVALAIKDLDLTLEEPEVTVTHVPLGVQKYLPPLEKFIVQEAKAQIQPHLKTINNMQLVPEDMRKLVKPSLRTIALTSKGDIIEFNLEVLGDVQKQRILQPLHEWFKTSGLK